MTLLKKFLFRGIQFERHPDWGSGALQSILLSIMPPLFLAGCATVNETGMFLSHVGNPSERSEITLSNGSRRTWYHFAVGVGDGVNGTIVFVPGSGCRSSDYARLWFSKLSGSFHVVSLDKVGVSPGAVNAGGCSDIFREEHRLASYSDDIPEFTQFAWKKYPNKNRVLIGASEGGWVVANIASRTSATHLVLLSSGGGTGLERMLLQAEIRGGAAEVEKTKAFYARVNEQTDMGSLVYGDQQGDYSVGYIQEILKFSADSHLYPMKAKVLVAHGGRDDIVPLALAHRLCERLNLIKGDVMYFYEPEGDHNLSTPDRQSGYRFFSALLAWLEARPSPFLNSTCPFSGERQ